MNPTISITIGKLELDHPQKNMSMHCFAFLVSFSFTKDHELMRLTAKRNFERGNLGIQRNYDTLFSSHKNFNED